MKRALHRRAAVLTEDGYREALRSAVRAGLQAGAPRAAMHAALTAADAAAVRLARDVDVAVLNLAAGQFENASNLQLNEIIRDSNAELRRRASKEAA